MRPRVLRVNRDPVDQLVGRTFRVDIRATDSHLSHLVLVSALSREGKVVGQVEQLADADRLDEVLRSLPQMLREAAR
jgi:hypothetical protein